ncbi:uncharacterized protein [Dermacentor andersoni]|uniref:uncharacterized protein n=1 Tax=Dermacentor andersoni TaxID=34620 RepID=UPI0024174555|nr:uncharacterized protein LOC126545502 [Dermacentor andersoni]
MLLLLLLELCSAVGTSDHRDLHAPFNMAGVQGEVRLTPSDSSGVNITVRLVGPPGEFSWSVREMPALFDAASPCADLGRARHDLSRRHGPLELNGTELSFEDDQLQLQGSASVWGRALLLQQGKTQACANLLLEEGSLHWAEALFAGPRVAGRVLFLASPSESLLAVLLFQGGRSSRYTWELLEADVLDAAPGCRFLQMLYDPDRADGDGCGRSAHERCRAGDLSAKHGPLNVGSPRGSRRALLDMHLPLGHRRLFLALRDEATMAFAACAPLRVLEARTVHAKFPDGGQLSFTQQSPFQPTLVRAQGLLGASFAVHPAPYCEGPLRGAPAVQLLAPVSLEPQLVLFGPRRIIGRWISVTRTDGNQTECARVGFPGPTVVGKATFHFPVSGQVFLRQDANDHQSETAVLVKFDPYGFNDTTQYKLQVHERRPGRDFYNWTARCVSAGDVFDPLKVGSGPCPHPLLCPVGALTAKGAKLAGAKRFFYTDLHLPLSGPNSVLQRSMVLHDSGAPPHRGDRLACAALLPLHPISAAVRRWLPAEQGVLGYVVWSQDSPEDSVRVEVRLRGLGGRASAYHVHALPVPLEQHFPCKAVRDGRGGVVELSDRYGNLAGKSDESLKTLDAELQLFGNTSVVGKSVVIQMGERRSVCGTIMPEMESRKGRELVAIATFDHPDSALQGYIRLRQLEYKDGATSDTFILVDLRYPGKYNRNQTKGHHWAVYVNQVAHDALEKSEKARCIAAGYRWNPYLAQSDKDSYHSECSPQTPLRCEMGDLSGKLGSLSIGTGPAIYTDTNLPLVGNFSVLGRSIIVFAQDGSMLRKACANIKHDIHLVRHVSVRKFPGFSSGTFMDHMRTMLNSSDWLVMSDSQAEQDILEGQCTQLTVHFFGPEAHRLQIEFGNLITFGSVRRQTRTGLKLIKTFYRPCKTLDEELSDQSVCVAVSLPLLLLMLLPPLMMA